MHQDLLCTGLLLSGIAVLAILVARRWRSIDPQRHFRKPINQMEREDFDAIRHRLRKDEFEFVLRLARGYSYHHNTSNTKVDSRLTVADAIIYFHWTP